MRSILVQPEPNAVSDRDSAMRVAPFLRTDGAGIPCDDPDPRSLADTCGVAATEEPERPPVQPFVLKFLVMSDQLLETAPAEAVRRTSAIASSGRAEIEIEHSNPPPNAH